MNFILKGNEEKGLQMKIMKQTVYLEGAATKLDQPQLPFTLPATYLQNHKTNCLSHEKVKIVLPEGGKRKKKNTQIFACPSRPYFL